MKFSQNINFKFYGLDEFTPRELHAVLKLRSHVFVVEQHCVYDDPDNMDTEAIHLIGNLEDNIVAYCRIYQSNKWHIGRISVDTQFRGFGIGKQSIQCAIAYCKTQQSQLKIEMSAQVYLSDYYMGINFKPSGKLYLEDGIPHIRMVYQD